MLEPFWVTKAQKHRFMLPQSSCPNVEAVSWSFMIFVEQTKAWIKAGLKSSDVRIRQAARFSRMGVSGRVSIALIKHPTKSKFGRKGFIKLTLPHCYSSPKRSQTGTQTGQEPGGRRWCRSHEGVLLIGLLLLGLLSLLFYTTQDHQSRDRTTHNGLDLLRPTLLLRMPDSLVLGLPETSSELRFPPFRWLQRLSSWHKIHLACTNCQSRSICLWKYMAYKKL